jgi:pantothenate kinase type III
MKILCDVGNTYTKILIISERIRYFKIKTSKFLLFIEKFKTADIFVSTVVDEIKTELKQKFKKIKFFTYKDLSKFIKIKYDTKNLGTDRIISAFCCKELFGGEIVIVSCGSTIVLDYVNKNCEYVGGEIFPGIKMLTKVLYQSTSKLPLVKKITTSKLIGKNTQECISAGIINFCASGIKNFINVLNPKTVVVTGGDANLFFKNLEHDNKYEINNLVLLGITLWGYYKNIFSKEEIKKILNFKKIFYIS